MRLREGGESYGAASIADLLQFCSRNAGASYRFYRFEATEERGCLSRVLHVDAGINHGLSGGAVLDGLGRLVGLAIARVDRTNLTVVIGDLRGGSFNKPPLAAAA